MYSEGAFMADKFTDVRIVDNFYQTSSFFPMPVVLVSTLAESGQTNLGPYSLCFPHYITGGKDHAMMLIARSTSNTAENITRTRVCALNFIPHKKKYMKNCVMLGYPGESTEEKMKNSIFTLIPSLRREQQKTGHWPDIVQEAVQIFECTWDDSYPVKPRKDINESHFLLHIDKIVMQEKWRDCLLKGKGFPRLPIDYGYRDNVRFWFARQSRPYAVPIPKEKGNKIETVKYACVRFDPNITWQDAACAKIVKVPSIFLNKVISGVVKAAHEQGVTVITPEFMDKIRDKRSKEK
jgi:flavin reductase (DIM6/NTAB) family NADH-FMN oxidoreductase RutF